MNSSLEEELHKMKQDQKRLERQSSAPASLDKVIRPSLQRQFSAGSWSNSIIGVNQAARTGGYSPSGYITSPTGSIHSTPWNNPYQLDRHSSKSSRRDHSLPEPLLEGRPLDISPQSRPLVALLPDQSVPIASPEASSNSPHDDRPPTSGSNDTFRQAQNAFADFDGAHYETNIQLERFTSSESFTRRLSLKQPPLARDSRVFREAQPGEKMIYYPAPVPVMLNLPQRLSKANFGEQERRRLAGLSGISNELRKSAAWLADQDSVKLHSQKPSLNLPPQLRASAFFDKPGIEHDLQLKDGSAVQTLDSILDAAAYAPVSAFTDHPIAGQLGREVYGPRASPRKSMQLQDAKAKKRRSSLSTMLRTRRSSTALSGKLTRTKSRDSKILIDGEDYASGEELDRVAADAIAPDADEIVTPDVEEFDTPQELVIAPTTLLAELQMRKAQQKQRNRTAADAFPNGMHSTLLELDAVAQLQQKARKTKHVTLAWEDHEEMEKQNFDDEEVPLGLLYPEKNRANHYNIHKPVGLLERREIEDNEPLSHRRARLRGEPIMSVKSETTSQIGQPPAIGDIPGLSPLPVAEDENETLGQRSARLKLEKEIGTAGQFTDAIRSELGLTGNVADQPSKTPDPEETLGQRRARLKEEAIKNGTKSVYNMADVLQAHPVGVRQVSNESNDYTTLGLQTQLPLMPASGAHMFPYPSSTIPYYAPQPANFNNVQSNGNIYQHNMPYMNGGLNASAPTMYGAPMPVYMQHHQYAFGNHPYVLDPMMGPPLDPKQRAKIDQWRQSVVQ
jgi:hypothetical protein